MAVSVFDLFKIGIGPSSSHTVGPMRAARLFSLRLKADGLLAQTHRVVSQMYGSLGATGKGHGTDKAVLLGLAGHEPDTVDVEQVPALLETIRTSSPHQAAGRTRGRLQRGQGLGDVPPPKPTLPCQRHALHRLR